MESFNSKESFKTRRVLFLKNKVCKWKESPYYCFFWAPASLTILLFPALVSLSYSSSSDLSSYPPVDTKPFCHKMLVTRLGSLSFTPCNILDTKLFAITCICSEALFAGISLFVLFFCVEMFVISSAVSAVDMLTVFQYFSCLARYFLPRIFIYSKPVKKKR